MPTVLAPEHVPVHAADVRNFSNTAVNPGAAIGVAQDRRRRARSHVVRRSG
jgi:hypothetical protein